MIDLTNYSNPNFSNLSSLNMNSLNSEKIKYLLLNEKTKKYRIIKNQTSSKAEWMEMF